MSPKRVSGNQVFVYGKNLKVYKSSESRVGISGTFLGALVYNEEDGEFKRYLSNKGANAVVVTGEDLEVVMSSKEYVIVKGEITGITPYRVEDDEAEPMPLVYDGEV